LVRRSNSLGLVTSGFCFDLIEVAFSWSSLQELSELELPQPQSSKFTRAWLRSLGRLVTTMIYKQLGEAKLLSSMTFRDMFQPHVPNLPMIENSPHHPF